MGVNHKGVEEMAVWNVQQVTNWGCAYFAASSTTKPVKATGGAVSNTSLTEAQAQATSTLDAFLGKYSDVSSRVLSLSVTGQTLRAVVQFKSTGDTARECKSVALLSDDNVIAILSSSEVIFTIPASSTSVVGVSVDFNIVFTNTGQATVDVSTANTAMQSDLDRFVSCYKAGDQQTGEAQTVRGRKTFTNEVTFQSTVDGLSRISAKGAVSGALGIFNEAYLETPAMARQVYAYTNESISRVQFKTVPVAISSESNAEIAVTGTIDISATGGIKAQANIYPKQTDTYSLGSANNRWNNIVAQYINGENYTGVAQTFAVTSTGIEVRDGDLTPVSGAPIYWSEIRRPYIAETYEFIGRDDKARIGTICLIEITRASAGLGFVIKRGGLVHTWATTAEGGNAKLLVYMQGATANLGEQYQFRLLENAFIYEASGQSSTYTRSKVWAVCVEGEE